MSEFLRQAFVAWDSVYLCGEDDYWPRLHAVLTYQHPDEYQICISETWVGDPPQGRCISPDAELSRLRILQSALRQDPDCILVDRGEEVSALLLQTALTGHRVIAGFPGSPRHALQCLLGEYTQMGDTQSRSLFFDQHGLWLYRPQEDKFEQVSVWKDGRFEDLISPVAPVAAPVFQPEAMSAPTEWGEPRPLLPALAQKFEGLSRTCYAPILADFPQERLLGQFGGTPRLETGQSWPCCGACGARLHLVCELDLSQLPDNTPLPSQGWFQLFYCSSDHCSHPDAWEPFSNNSLARVLPKGEKSELELPNSNFLPKAILAWEALTDYPHSEERPDLDEREEVASYNLEEPAFIEHFCLQNPAELEQAQAYFCTHYGDKLLGWPAWSQGAEYPCCPQCAQSMQMLLQINNNGSPNGPPGSSSCHGQIFAADGNGHVFLCPEHGEMTFAWACG